MKWPNQIKDEVFSVNLIRDFSSLFGDNWKIKILSINNFKNSAKEVFEFPLETFFNDQLNFSKEELSPRVVVETLNYVLLNLIGIDKNYQEMIFKEDFIEINEELKRNMGYYYDEKLDCEEEKKKFLYECIGRLSEYVASKIDLREMVVQSLKQEDSFDEIADSKWGSLVRQYDPNSIVNDIYLDDVESEVRSIFNSLSKEEKFCLWIEYFEYDDLLSEWMDAGQIPSSFDDVKFFELHEFLGEIAGRVVSDLSADANEEYYRRLNAAD